jgi:hypothetical protein
MKIGPLEVSVSLGDLALVAVAIVVVLDYIANGRL